MSGLLQTATALRLLRSRVRLLRLSGRSRQVGVVSERLQRELCRACFMRYIILNSVHVCTQVAPATDAPPSSRVVPRLLPQRCLEHRQEQAGVALDL